ncbi:Sodium/myo-inositol cotransporter [Armadillidium nasatum]|uniref:Sodium/myo-inositol cotransporter n=1 Tax=Armadillidium nasatum TaxID=96803 RepID=A0A5N5TFG5_9CRUS|nr:Sodium/myo-inositol cotransporter [Armadillidium nasatum]
MIGASLFASNIGSEHFIGLAGSGAASGIYVGAFELNAMILLQLLGWVNTLPEYMNKRFSGNRIRTCLAILSLMLYIFTKISVNMYSGAIFIEEAFHWKNLYLSVTVLVGLTALLTIGGGLSAVIYTDTLQFFIMNFGSLFVAIKAFNMVGGYEELLTKYMTAIPEKLIPNTTCGIPRADSWVMLRDADPSKSDMPWPAFLLGQTPASIWYWCADQMMVQRVMAAKSLSHAQGSTIFAGYTKLLPLFFIILPGMIARVLYPNEIGCADPVECQKYCGSDTCTNYAYPKLAFSLMPNGLRGVMLSVMLSALISDLTSIFNSASTLFTMDIWRLFRPRASSGEKLLVGRTFIIILVLISILWIPIIEKTQGGELYIYIQAIAAYLAPPIAAVYCLAILYKRINETGAFWGLMSGFLVGVIRMVLDFSYKEPGCFEENQRPLIIRHFHYMYFAMLLFWLTIGVAVVVSHCTDPPAEWMLIRTTFYTRYDKREREDEITVSTKPELELLQIPNETKDQVAFQEKLTKGKVANKTGIMDIICCLETGTDAKSKANETEMNKHVAQLSNLHQEKWEKNLLNTMLVIIVLLATY